MNTEELKAIINDTGDSATVLLREHCPTVERRFKKMTNDLRNNKK